MLNHIMHSNQQVVTHPVEHLTADDIASLPELPMTQAEDGTYFCDGESTQSTTKGHQLFDKSTAQDGFVKSDGTVEVVNWIKCTDYIRVSGSYVYMYHCIDTISNIRYYTFYDSEKNFISGAVQLFDGKVDIPENAVYFRCNIQISLVDSAMICVDYTPTEYEPYTGGKPSPNPDYPSPITNTYPAGTYKAICGDKVYKVVLDDDLRSVPNVADRVVIDAGRGKLKIEKGIGYIESYTDETVETVYMSSTGELTEGATVIYQLSTPTNTQSIPTQLLTIASGRSVQLTGTVNDKADYLAVKGDSWQLVQDEIVDADGNVTQPVIPSPDYPSEIKDVGGTLRSCGWNLIDVPQFILPDDHGKEVEINIDGNCIIQGTFNITSIKNATQAILALIKEDGSLMYISQSNIAYGYPIRWKIIGIKIVNWCGLVGTMNLQISIEKKPYDRHRGNSITLPTLRGLPDGTRDTLCVDRKAKRAWVERKVGLVESYNGESVGDVFMSNTGELSTGAVVHYKLAEPVIEELPYSDYLLDTCQWETNISFVDCDSNLVPEIEVGCKVLGR